MGSKRSTEKMERLRGRLFAGMAGQRDHRRAGRRRLRQAAGLRQLRLPGEPRDQLRLPGLRQRLAQALPPGGVLRRAAQRPADGLLLPAVAGRRRPPARGAGPRPGHQPRPGRGGAAARPGQRRAGRPSGWGWPRCGRSGWSWPRRSTPSASGPAPYRDLADLAAPGPADRAAGRGAGHRGRLRLLRASDRGRGRRCGRPGRRPRSGPDQLPGTAVGLDAPPLPGMTDAELTVADVWATGVSPDSHPIQHLRERLDDLGAVPIDRLDAVGRRRFRPASPAAGPPGCWSAGSSRTGSARPPRAG